MPDNKFCQYDSTKIDGTGFLTRQTTNDEYNIFIRSESPLLVEKRGGIGECSA